MNIKNLGQALQMSFKLEDAGIELYTKAAQETQNKTVKNLFEEFCVANQQRRKIVEAIYNENVNSDMDTGILAPIEPMDEEKYLPNPISDDIRGAEAVLSMAAMERSVERFYMDLMQRLPSGPRSIPRRIKKLADENSMRESHLRKMLVNKSHKIE